MWEQIRSNRRKSVALVVVVAALLFGLGFVFGEAAQPGAGVVGLLIAGAVWFILTLVAYFEGDRILLSVSGAQRIEKSHHPQLYNIVEEMTIAAGLPTMPEVYIIEDPSPNAFATGRKPERAAVAVTTGLLSRLNRDQLQGVIAHELSHIVNRDVLFMTMVGIMVGAIVMVSEVFLRGLFHSRGGRYRASRRGGGQGQALMLLVAVVLAILAPILARLIYLAVSRRREYLADANAAVLTRYPEGLASALEAIASSNAPVASANRATAPMYIVNPMRAQGEEGWGLFSTHPPTSERVRILRSMAGAASYQEYQRAWQQTAKNPGSLPPSVLALASDAPIREGDAVAPSPAETRRQTRLAGDALRSAGNFRTVECGCGVKIKVPPDYAESTVACPRCRRQHPIPGTIRKAAPRAS